MSQLESQTIKPGDLPASGAKTQGVHHVGLTVGDLEAAVGFFCTELGFGVVGGKPDYPAAFVSDGQTMLTLWQAREPEQARAFDRHCQIGLHHLALKLAANVSLTALHQRLAGLPGVAVEFAPEPLGATGLRHMICLIPGGIRLELVSHG